MAHAVTQHPESQVKTPKNLSPRIQWLRDYYFKGTRRRWNNEFTAWTTGTPWDIQYDEFTYYIVPEMYAFFQTFRSSFKQVARPVRLHDDFWTWPLAQRKAWFTHQVVTNDLPKEILPGDLIAGARFNIMTSSCLTEQQARAYCKMIDGKHGARRAVKSFHDHGYGNAGATSGHLIPDYQSVIDKGFEHIHNDLTQRYETACRQNNSDVRDQLQAMITASTMPRDLAAGYADLARQLAGQQSDPDRKNELRLIAENLDQVPWRPAQNFWQAVQSLWITHMLVMADENYPGPGTSFGRFDQYLYPYWKKSLDEGMPREFGKEILKCFWIHANTAYDAMIRTGSNQGITAGYGQLITLSGLGPDNRDMTNDLTYAILEVIDDMSPILEPKPNIRLHRNSPPQLLDKIVDMIASSQGAPFLLNFDERATAGLLHQAEKSNAQHLINENNVFDYAPVGCLENTMVGNDRSGTVDNNLNLLKAVELALNAGRDLLPTHDPLTGNFKHPKRSGPDTGNPAHFKTWEQFFDAYRQQTRYIVRKIVDLYERSERSRAMFAPTPYLSCLVKGCAESGKDITQGGAQLSYTTINAVTFATTVDSLLAVKYLVFDKKTCTIDQLITALKANWQGFETIQGCAIHRAPKYGRDNEQADAMARRVMQTWTEETWKHKTKSTNRQFRPGMLSWNYWVSDSFILPASPDGRPKGRFLSNALCPSNGADIFGPTANTNSVGAALADPDTTDNCLPNGGSHTITFNPSLTRCPERKEKFKAFLRGYAQNGGTALQINMIDADMLRDAQLHPENYHHLLVRITGYNAYFTTIGKELQNEIIARESHRL